MVRVIWILLIVIGGLLPKNQDRELLITKKVVTVKGQTSLGAFSCDYEVNGLSERLKMSSSSNVKTIEFEIPVRDFSCGNFLLNKDFRRTIKAEDFPISKVTVSDLKHNYGHYSCSLKVLLVGKHFEYNDFLLTRTAIGLEGDLNMTFSDLDLTAPQRLGGLIKVEEKIDLKIVLGM